MVPSASPFIIVLQILAAVVFLVAAFFSFRGKRSVEYVSLGLFLLTFATILMSLKVGT